MMHQRVISLLGACAIVVIASVLSFDLFGFGSTPPHQRTWWNVVDNVSDYALLPGLIAWLGVFSIPFIPDILRHVLSSVAFVVLNVGIWYWLVQAIVRWAYRIAGNMK